MALVLKCAMPLKLIKYVGMKYSRKYNNEETAFHDRKEVQNYNLLRGEMQTLIIK